MYKELNVTVEMPAVKDVYAVKVVVDGYEPEDNFKSFKLRAIQWQTYCDEWNDDIHHIIYDQWITGQDLLDVLEQIREFVGKLPV